MSTGDAGWAAHLRRLLERPLSTLEQAELLRILQEVPGVHNACRQLRRQLRTALTPEWVAIGDLTEVFAVLDALHSFDRKMPGGDTLAAVAKRLLAGEAAVGGPYISATGHAPDFSANAYIANCLSWLAAPLPRLEQFLHQEIQAGRYQARDLIALARAYPGLAQAALSQPLAGVPSVITYYVRRQAEPQVNYGRSAPRTLTMPADAVLAALTLYASYGQPLPVKASNPVASRLPEVISQARSSYETLPEALQPSGKTALDRLLKIDSAHEITLLPHFFAAAFGYGPPQVSTMLLNQLGAANVHAWLAYTIYDDFLDDEGKPPFLPIANVALRFAADLYRQILHRHTDFQAYATGAFIAVDAANAWETHHWRATVSGQHMHIGRLPDFGDRQLLADRALLHILGPIGVLAASGHTANDPVWTQTIPALRHYLIARQLADDLHDWVKDLRAGHLSYVVTHILRHLALPAGIHALEPLVAICREQFWQHLLPELCQVTIMHTRQAKEGLQPYIRHPDNQLFSFLNVLEESMHTALARRQQSREFLQKLKAS